MSELRALTAAVRRLRQDAQPFVSASVVAVRGSGYRKAGARMIATPAEWVAGSISGGCLERDITAKGFWYTRSARASLITYDQAADDLSEAGGTGCLGVVDVLVERHESGALAAADVFAAVERCVREEEPALVLTVIRSTQAELPLAARAIVQAGAWQLAPEHACLRELFGAEAEQALLTLAPPRVVRRWSDAGELEVLVEPILPPIHLYVFGSGHDAAPLVALAKGLGWSVSVWDASPRSSARERFAAADHYLTVDLTEAVLRCARSARGVAVVMGHHLARDRAAVQELLHSRVPYIGILGSRQRTGQILSDCQGVDCAQSRIFAPVGLALGAETPSEIALAIVAQVQTVMSGAQTGRADLPRTAACSACSACSASSASSG